MERYTKSWAAEQIEEVNLCGADLRGAQFVGATIMNSNLSSAHLVRADLSHAKLMGVNLRDANLSRASLRGTALTGCSLTGAILLEGELEEVTLTATDAGRVTAPRAVWRHARFAGVNFRMADFSYGVFEDCDLSNSCLERSSLTGARFVRCTLDNCSFDFADVRRAVFTGCAGIKTSFRGADLEATYAEHSRLREADFYWAETHSFAHSNCDFTGTRWPERVAAAYGPTRVYVPQVHPKPLYRRGADEDEWRNLVRGLTDAEG